MPELSIRSPDYLDYFSAKVVKGNVLNYTEVLNAIIVIYVSRELQR